MFGKKAGYSFSVKGYSDGSFSLITLR